jgi:hypothetical protein
MDLLYHIVHLSLAVQSTERGLSEWGTASEKDRNHRSLHCDTNLRASEQT